MKSIVMCECSQCGKPLERIKAEFDRCITKTFFCNKDCRCQFKRNKQVYNCVTCSKQVERTPSAVVGNVFCSQSCSALYNNKVSVRKTRTKKCKVCQKLILSGYTYCQDCYVTKYYLDNKTLEEATNTKGRHASRYSGIRGHARNVYRDSDLPKECKCCGYSKHIEICHIKDIASFPATTLIKEINSIDNLVALCRNHHWELDHNSLSNEDFEKIVGRERLELSL